MYERRSSRSAACCDLVDGSSIVLLSSLQPCRVGTLSAYAATKGAIDTLVKHFARRARRARDRVNAVAPGVVAPTVEPHKTDAGTQFTSACRR